MKQIMAFASNSRNNKKVNVAPPEHFSTLGKHKASTIGRDLKIDKLGGVLNDLRKRGTREAQEKASFYIASKVHDRINDYLKLQTGGSFSVGSLSNGYNNLINHSEPNISFQHSASTNVVSTFAEISTRIYKEKFTFGTPTKRRLLEKSKNHTIVKREKLLVDTESDYLSSRKRRGLTSYAGINETLYTFLMTDTFLTLEDYELLYKIHHKKFKTKLSNSYFYGDSLSDSFRIKIKSETDAYSMHCKVHVMKLKNNITLKELIENTFSSNLNGEVLNDSKIPIDRQYSVPSNTDNPYKCEVVTALNTPLTLSDYFNDNVRTLKTFSQHLGPRCILDLTIKQHHGRGIFLNHIFNVDRDKKLKDQPSSYFCILETIGDRRASITRQSDGANFDCVGPFRFTTTFNTSLKYLAEDINDNEKPIFSKFVKNDSDFTDTELREHFQADREPRIHVAYEEIHVDRNTKNKIKPYILRYDEPRMVQLIDPKLTEVYNELKDAGLQGLVSEVSESIMNPNIKFGANVTEPDGSDEDVRPGTAKNTTKNITDEGGLDGPFNPEDPEFRGLRGGNPDDPDD